MGYDSTGFFQPINDPSGSNPSVFKQGSTIPVKFALLEASGRLIADSMAQAIANACEARLTWGRVQGPTGPVSESVSSNPANSGNCFRYDPTADQFILNLGTKGLSAGSWKLQATVMAGGAPVATHAVIVSLR